MATATVGYVMTGWADLEALSVADNSLDWLVRMVTFLGQLVLAYGVVIPLWLRIGDTWSRSLREIAIATCAVAVLALAGLVSVEWGNFSSGNGCGTGVLDSLVAGLFVIGIIVGLIAVAIRPKLDPFAMSETSRIACIYVAELVAALLVLHLYLSLPWLFRREIRQYWPYLLMALSFCGAGLAGVLKKRELQVLSKPLFQTAAILPALVSLGIWWIDSQADAALVLLAGGFAYLVVSHSSGSILAAAASVLSWNLALWVFYNRYPTFSFFENPQWWLIPPAVSVLIASQLMANRLAAGQVATIRYISVALIYISSTSEVFIHGMGKSLWPPVVLATLAITGILAGMAFQIRAYLYFGSVFLLLAMVAMVSHAQQRLDHVWPWWAFGITSGVVILVMFGLFEKHRNKIKATSGGEQDLEL